MNALLAQATDNPPLPPTLDDSEEVPVSYMVGQALKRPKDYNKLSSSDQWSIDRQLGILDWDPTLEEQQEFTRRWTQMYAPPPLAPPEEVAKPVGLRKETVLEGHYATGDQEAFCFDTHAGPTAHENAVRPSEPEGHGAWLAWQKQAESCRVYPLDLLPEGTYQKKGRWKITVEFEPEEDQGPGSP